MFYIDKNHDNFSLNCYCEDKYYLILNTEVTRCMHVCKQYSRKLGMGQGKALGYFAWREISQIHEHPLNKFVNCLVMIVDMILF